jgi:outer membrane protein
MGVPAESNVRLTSTFDILPALPPLAELQVLAQHQNPGLLALQSRSRAAELGVTAQKGEYFPTLTISTGIGGQTYSYKDPNLLVGQVRAQTLASQQSCIRTEEVRAQLGLPNNLAGCTGITFTDADAAAIRRANAQFPFDFQSTPRAISAQISLPLFDGFAREQRVEEALVRRENARYQERARSLALEADVAAAYFTLQAAQQTVELQGENAAKARQELHYAEEQYVVGLATFVDLTTSRAAFAQAETDRINALYDYHKAFAALESTVGRSLR